MTNLLEVTGLTKKFTPTAGVEDVSFALKPGRVLAYLGHNGAGKTTTIRSVLGLLKKDSGTVAYQGAVCDTEALEYDRVRLNFGVCLDTPGFYPGMTALRNLELFASLYDLRGARFRARAEELLKKLGLYEVRGNAVKTYSKGMQQKLALARAILHKPKVLFLDEPMSGLDPEARILMRGYLEELSKKEGLAVFLTSHDLNEVEQLADEVFILEKGKVILSGELEALKKARGAERYVITFEAAPAQDAARALAGALSASFVKLQGRELTVESEKPVELAQAVTAGAGLGLKTAEFKKQSASLEQIYFESLHRNENKP
ncbi:MAG: hypothetical protein A2016_00955 [Elusimicrobia bacterium GWF2_62_30]|nr:MAG: hypothetical protein A2016_00955 [Elusimicrobia bacterium GWF2_62_30]